MSPKNDTEKKAAEKAAEEKAEAERKAAEKAAEEKAAEERKKAFDPKKSYMVAPRKSVVGVKGRVFDELSPLAAKDVHNGVSDLEALFVRGVIVESVVK